MNYPATLEFAECQNCAAKDAELAKLRAERDALKEVAGALHAALISLDSEVSAIRCGLPMSPALDLDVMIGRARIAEKKHGEAMRGEKGGA